MCSPIVAVVMCVVLWIPNPSLSTPQQAKQNFKAHQQHVVPPHFDPRHLEDIIVQRLGPLFGTRIDIESEEITDGDQVNVAPSANRRARTRRRKNNPILRSLRKLFERRKGHRQPRTENLIPEARSTTPIRANNISQGSVSALSPSSGTNIQSNSISSQLKPNEINKLSRAPTLTRPFSSIILDDDSVVVVDNENASAIIIDSLEDDHIMLFKDANISPGNDFVKLKEKQSTKFVVVKDDGDIESRESKEVHLNFNSHHRTVTSKNEAFQIGNDHFINEFGQFITKNPSSFRSMQNFPVRRPKVDILVVSNNETPKSVFRAPNLVRDEPEQVFHIIQKLNKPLRKYHHQINHNLLSQSGPNNMKFEIYDNKFDYLEHFRPTQSRGSARPSSHDAAEGLRHFYGPLGSSRGRKFNPKNIPRHKNSKNMIYSNSITVRPKSLSQGSQNYHFGYEVSEDEVQFGHEETRDGDRVVGEYQVLLPNGYRQVVTYYADKTGYHPTITYEAPIAINPRKVYNTKAGVALTFPGNDRKDSIMSESFTNVDAIESSLGFRDTGNNDAIEYVRKHPIIESSRYATKEDLFYLPTSTFQPISSVANANDSVKHRANSDYSLKYLSDGKKAEIFDLPIDKEQELSIAERLSLLKVSPEQRFTSHSSTQPGQLSINPTQSSLLAITSDKKLDHYFSSPSVAPTTTAINFVQQSATEPFENQYTLGDTITTNAVSPSSRDSLPIFKSVGVDLPILGDENDWVAVGVDNIENSETLNQFDALESENAKRDTQYHMRPSRYRLGNRIPQPWKRRVFSLTHEPKLHGNKPSPNVPQYFW